MKIEEYKDLSVATLSNHFNTSENIEENLTELCSIIESKTAELDELKKVIFYNKNYQMRLCSPQKKLIKSKTQETNDLLHGAIGLVTESVEILNEITNALKNNRKIDYVNINEELGDIMWYFSIFLRNKKINKFDDILETNINKLKSRYGDKFDAHLSLNRNLEEERRILENGGEDK